MFTVLFYVINGLLPGFNQLALFKLTIYQFLLESLGFSCASGPLNFCVHNYFPNYWHALRIGTVKVPMIYSLPKIRGYIDVIIYVFKNRYQEH